MADEKTDKERLKISCSACKQRMDVTDLAPFTKIKCVKCGVSLVVPKRLAQFILMSRMGSGGMGEVYRAMDTSLNRQVAIKILNKDMADNPMFVENFSREARAAAALNHHNIAQIYSFGQDGGQYFLAMELVDRGSLWDIIEAKKQLQEAQVIEIGLQVGAALRAAWTRGLLHQDIKPNNVLFNEDGVAKIVDFGLAQFSEGGKSGLNRPLGAVWGTAEYISPEKLESKREDFRSDLYSLGATLFHALAGRPPFEGAEQTEVAQKRLKEPAPSVKKFNPHVSEQTAQIIAKMLARKPEDRFATYDQLLTDLTAAKRVAIQNYKVVNEVRAERQHLRRQRSVQRLVGIAVVILCFGIGIWTLNNLQTVSKLPVVGNLLLLIYNPPEGTPKPPEDVGSTGAVPPEIANPPPSTSPEEIWRKRFDAALGNLAQGNYAQASDGFGALLNAPNLLAGKPARKNTLLCLRGLSQSLQGLATESETTFVTLAGDQPLADIPTTVTAENAPVIIAQMFTGQLPQEKLESNLNNFPSAPRALARLSLAVKNLNGDTAQLADANRFLLSYLSAPRIEGDESTWLESLRPLATRLRAEYGALQTSLNESKKLRDAEKWQEAIDRLTPAQIQPPLTTPALLAHADSRRGEYATEWNSLRATTAARLAEQLEQELKIIGTVEADVAKRNLISIYSFAAAADAYAKIAPQISHEDAKAKLENKLTTYKLLAALKKYIVETIPLRSLPAGTIALRGQPITDSLVRGTDTAAIFKSNFGEYTMNWVSIPPAEFTKIFAYYLPKPTAITDAGAKALAADRYLALALFYAEFRLDKTIAAQHATTAALLHPPLKDTITRYFPAVE